MNRAVGLLLTGCLAVIASNQWASTRAQTTSLVSDVRDTVGLFGGEEVEAARSRLRELETEFKVATIVETIDSLKGKSIDEVTVALARRTGMSGIFVLIAKRENKLEVLPSHRVEAALPRSKRNSIRSAFVEKFRKKEFDEGLKQGVEVIAATLREASREDKLPSATELPPQPAFSGSGSVRPVVPSKPDATSEAARESGLVRNANLRKPLILREQVRLTLGGAQAIIEAAQQQAELMKLRVNISVVDDGGHPLAFARMDGARPASAYTALTKAITAATYRQPSGPFPPGTSQPDLLLNIGLQNAAAAGGGKMTTLLGGLPIIVDGQVIGGVGVGGGSGEQDRTIAKAGVDRFLEALKASTQPVAKETQSAKPTTSNPSVLKPTTPEVTPADERDF